MWIAETRGTALVACGLLLLSGSTLYADVEPPPMQLGARIRVSLIEGSRAAHGKKLSGALVGLSDAAVTLETTKGRTPVVVPRESVAQFEVSVRRSRRKKGALIGLGVGMAAGLIMVAADNGGDCPPPEEDFFGICRGLEEDFSGPEWYAFGAALFGGVGAGLGAIVAGGEKWEPITGDHLRLALKVGRVGGVQIGVSLVF